MATKKPAKKARSGALAQKQAPKQQRETPATARLNVRGEVDASRFLALRTIAGGGSDAIQMVMVPARRKQK